MVLMVQTNQSHCVPRPIAPRHITRGLLIHLIWFDPQLIHGVLTPKKITSFIRPRLEMHQPKVQPLIFEVTSIWMQLFRKKLLFTCSEKSGGLAFLKHIFWKISQLWFQHVIFNPRFKVISNFSKDDIFLRMVCIFFQTHIGNRQTLNTQYRGKANTCLLFLIFPQIACIFQFRQKKILISLVNLRSPVC